MNAAIAKRPRDRIIEASAKLFYDRDANSVGVDKICEDANVSKRTLYKYFPTKELLVAATVNTLGDMWSGIYTAAGSDDPIVRITHVFKLLESKAESDDFRGCHQMNTSVELRNSEALAKDTAKDLKNGLYDYFKQQAILLGVTEPDILAEQLILLFDGCNAWILMRHKFPISTFKTLDLLLAEPA